jgi:hypothetical protein
VDQRQRLARAGGSPVQMNGYVLTDVIDAGQPTKRHRPKSDSYGEPTPGPCSEPSLRTILPEVNSVVGSLPADQLVDQIALVQCLGPGPGPPVWNHTVVLDRPVLRTKPAQDRRAGVAPGASPNRPGLKWTTGGWAIGPIGSCSAADNRGRKVRAKVPPFATLRERVAKLSTSRSHL